MESRIDVMIATLSSKTRSASVEAAKGLSTVGWRVSSLRTILSRTDCMMSGR